MAILSRFRSRERDIETDVGRVLPIRDAVEAALREAEAEHAGLRARLADASARAAFLFGDGLESEADGDPVRREQLKTDEGFVVRGQRRHRYLDRQIGGLREMKAILETIVNPETDLASRG